jgi:hypothetical protein
MECGIELAATIFGSSYRRAADASHLSLSCYESHGDAVTSFVS